MSKKFKKQNYAQYLNSGNEISKKFAVDKKAMSCELQAVKKDVWQL